MSDMLIAEAADAHTASEPDAAVIWSEIVEELKTVRTEALRAERGR
jgi:hypothetical protein